MHSPVHGVALEEVVGRDRSIASSLHPEDQRQTNLFFEQAPSPIRVDSVDCPQVKEEKTDRGLKIGGRPLKPGLLITLVILQQQLKHRQRQPRTTLKQKLNLNHARKQPKNQLKDRTLKTKETRRCLLIILGIVLPHDRILIQLVLQWWYRSWRIRQGMRSSTLTEV